MEIVLNILILIVGIADAIAFFEMQKRIKGWARQLVKTLSDEEIKYVEKRTKLIQVLSAIGGALLLVRVVVFELLPLIRG